MTDYTRFYQPKQHMLPPEPALQPRKKRVDYNACWEKVHGPLHKIEG